MRSDTSSTATARPYRLVTATSSTSSGEVTACPVLLSPGIARRVPRKSSAKLAALRAILSRAGETLGSLCLSGQRQPARDMPRRRALFPVRNTAAGTGNDGIDLLRHGLGLPPQVPPLLRGPLPPLCPRRPRTRGGRGGGELSPHRPQLAAAAHLARSLRR